MTKEKRYVLALLRINALSLGVDRKHEHLKEYQDDIDTLIEVGYVEEDGGTLSLTDLGHSVAVDIRTTELHKPKWDALQNLVNFVESSIDTCHLPPLVDRDALERDILERDIADCIKTIADAIELPVSEIYSDIFIEHWERLEL